MESKPRVFLADDHTILLDAFRTLLASSCDVVGTATTGRELLDLAPELKPDLIITDIAMPGLNGIDAARQIRSRLPDVKILFLTQNDDPDIAATAMEDGASGFLLKECAGTELLTAIDAALRGRTYLTPILAGAVLDSSRRRKADRPKLTDRQREVLQLVAEGHSMTKIADDLCITARTVAHHKYKIMEMLGAENTADLVRHAIREGLISG